MAINLCSWASGRLAVVSLSSAVFSVGCGDTGQEEVQSGPATRSTVVIQGATIFDGQSNQLLEDAVMVLEGERIQQIGSRGEVQIPPGATVHDASGKFIIPTLIDLHIHIGITSGTEFHTDHYTADNIERDANRYLYYGIGHVLSLGFDRETIFQVRDSQSARERGGARVLATGRAFSPPGGWTAPVPLGDTVESQWMNRPGSVEQAREMIQSEAAKDVDAIKIYVDDVNGTAAKFTPEMYGAIIDEAHRHDLKVIAHVLELEDAKELMRRGVDALTHVPEQLVDEEFLTLAKESGVVQIGALVQLAGMLDYSEGLPAYLSDTDLAALFSSDVLEAFRSPEYAERLSDPIMLANAREALNLALRNTTRMLTSGVPFALGTDAGTPGRFPGLWSHRELELLVRAGLTPQHALRAATVEAARFLGIDDQVGTLQAGRQANFIVLNANPIADITNTQRIDAVWLLGQEVNRNALSAAER